MAIVTYGPLINAACGSVSDITFSTSIVGPTARKRNKRTNPQTANQLAARAALAVVSKTWQSLTLAQQMAWDAAAALIPYTTCLGKIKTLPGFQYYCQLNTILCTRGAALLTTPPSSLAVDRIFDAALWPVMTSNATTQLLSWWNADTATTSEIQIQATPVWPWGAIPDAHQLRNIATIPASESPPQSVTKAYTDVYGDLPTATPYKIRMRWTPINPATGVRGCPIDQVLAIANAAPSPPPAAGSSCSLAGAIAPSVVNGYTGSTVAAQWVLLETVTGTTYTVIWDSTDVSGAPTLWSGPSCSSLTALAVFAAQDAATFTAQAGNVYLISSGPWSPGAIWSVLYNPVQIPLPPQITSISPNNGPPAGGTAVTITGTGFTLRDTVQFGTVPATTWTTTPPTKIIATSPAQAAGTVDVSVHGPNGCSPPTTADKYTYNPGPPTVTMISPTSGTTAGGTSVTITGTNYIGVTAVKFGATNAAGYVVNTTTQITATTPAEAAGTVDTTVTNASGTSPTTSADQFTFIGPPTVTVVAPNLGPAVGGQSVTITGTEFTAVSAVHFGATPAASYVVNTITQITAITPAEATGTVHTTVTTAIGTSATSSADQYTFANTPTVTGLSPTNGPTAGGTSVTVTGTNFTGATSVTFGGITAAFVFNTSTQVTATSPTSASAGSFDVVVTTPAGSSPTNPSDLFTYIDPPTVTSLTPHAGPLAGGGTINVNGSGFTGVTAVDFGSTSTTFTFVSDILIFADLPAGTGTVHVTVTTPYGTSATTTADEFTYVTAPTVTGISPTSGPTAGGTPVTVTGTNFYNPTPYTVSCQFGSVAASSIVVVSTTQITCVSPAGTGTVDVIVGNAGGNSPTSPADEFTYTAAVVGGAIQNVANFHGFASRSSSYTMPTGANPRTIACWVQIDTGSGPAMLWSYGNQTTPSVGNLWIWWNGSQLNIGGGTFGNITGLGSVAASTKYCIVFTFDGTDMLLLINNATAYSGPPPGTMTTDNTGILTFGTCGYTPGWSITGAIQDIRVDDIAWTSTQYSQYYNSGTQSLTAGPTPAVSWWKTNEGTGTTAHDSVGTNDLTLESGATFITGF